MLFAQEAGDGLRNHTVVLVLILTFIKTTSYVIYIDRYAIYNSSG